MEAAPVAGGCGFSRAKPATVPCAGAAWLHFHADALPQAVVNEVWSLTLVSLPDFRPVPNELDRFALSTWSNVQREADGSLKLLASTAPRDDMPASNWLPSPEGQPFSLTFRTFVSRAVVQNGDWFPPAVDITG